MNNFEKMQVAMRYWLHGKGFSGAVRAMEFAAEHHIGFRKDGSTPEFHHQISIASYIRTLPELMWPEETLATTFLHDVVEDYDVDLHVIESQFGKPVRRAVSLLSKKIGGYEIGVKEYYEAMQGNAIASIVKGADRMHNFQTMSDVFTAKKQETYIEECENFIFPMLKIARKKFPEQEPTYENIKHVLYSQIGLLKIGLEK